MAEWYSRMHMDELFKLDTVDGFKNELEKTITVLKDIHKEYPIFL